MYGSLTAFLVGGGGGGGGGRGHGRTRAIEKKQTTFP